MTTGPLHANIIKRYMAAHPEVDWDRHIVTLARQKDKGGWYASGHRAWTAEDERRLIGCWDQCGCSLHAGS